MMTFDTDLAGIVNQGFCLSKFNLREPPDNIESFYKIVDIRDESGLDMIQLVPVPDQTMIHDDTYVMKQHVVVNQVLIELRSYMGIIGWSVQNMKLVPNFDNMVESENRGTFGQEDMEFGGSTEVTGCASIISPAGEIGGVEEVYIGREGDNYTVKFDNMDHPNQTINYTKRNIRFHHEWSTITNRSKETANCWILIIR
ncbi:hypothetical protein LXL04_008250 [Taraxacum kok-saghyz]